MTRKKSVYFGEKLPYGDGSAYTRGRKKWPEYSASCRAFSLRLTFNLRSCASVKAGSHGRDESFKGKQAVIRETDELEQIRSIGDWISCLTAGGSA
ncbi:hypothetical protein Zmor_013054 [Zophobas morio]|uniref:Uncharacterized protein n=1 Tax=Zophobas morio TaxID=2755281 RepID=A0AA38ICL0_9CUCU|nr:hypothetical protein Zmor_013054 [Zophobas morio]